MKSPKNHTSWGSVADWYDELLEKDANNYQSTVILPNILRLLTPLKAKRVLDLACGQGFFSRAFFEVGAHVVGVDIAKELILHAEERSPKEITYYASSADQIPMIPNASVDIVTIILAIQNIEHIDAVLKECSRVLTKEGQLLLVLNHPAFRIPKQSAWGYDESGKIQYRRLDRYMSEIKTSIEMHPGKKDTKKTITFHRPLQFYFKLFDKYHFSVVRLEEWISHKKSGVGPRQKAEDIARKEFPLFMGILLKKRILD